MKEIGPVFGDELRSAGLAGVALSWTSEGSLSFGSSVTGAQKTAVEAVYAAHDPSVTETIVGAQEKIDTSAGEARARYITVTPGQDAVYILKAMQAAAYIAAGKPADASSYPLLEKEAYATGVTVSVLAEMVISLQSEWALKAATIEAMRIAGKNSVAECAPIDRGGLLQTALTNLAEV